MESQRNRPLGVTIIAILLVIAGIISFVSGLILLIILVGIVFLALGIAYFVMAYGLWKGRGWAWTISLILSWIGIIAGIVYIIQDNLGGGIVNIIINGVIIYYLTRANVKAFFGK
jgi:uncharacterized membrane protein HdeD (DUF308 family)